MRKEVSFAIIIGIILGGAILFGINLANQSTASLPSTQVPQIITPTPITNGEDKEQSSNTSELSLSSHQDLDVVFETPLKITGKSQPNSKVIIITEEDDIITTTEKDGVFSSPINLVNGENKISLTTLNSDNKTITKTYTLYYSDKPLE